LARAVVVVEAQLLVLAVVVEAQLLVLAVVAVEARLVVLAVVAVGARLVVALTTEALSLDLFSHRSFSAGMARISPTSQQPTYERVPRSR
jgi:hypothetical protein